MKSLFALPLLLLGTGALALECQFDTECYESEPCGATQFNLSVLADDQKLVTDFGDLTIVAIKQTPKLTTLFATGDGAEYLLSTTTQGARFSAQMNDGPQVVTYLGQCKGAAK